MSPDTDQTSKQPAAGSGEPVRRPFEIISSRFMKRTLLMVVVSLVLVAAMLVRINPAWPGYYLFGGVWALGFFILTPLILRDLIGHQRIFRGLGLVDPATGEIKQVTWVQNHVQDRFADLVLAQIFR